MTLLSYALFLAVAVHAEPAWKTDLKPALEQAAVEKKLALIDFQAPWCYSCYYMDKNVLSKARFAEATEPLVLVKLDVDQPAGRELKEKFAVTFLPTYVLVDGKGREKGRIVGEQRESDFIDRLAAILRGTASDDAARSALREKAKKGDAAAVEKLLDRPADCQTPYDVMSAKALSEKDLKTAQDRLETLSRASLFVDAPKRCADFRSGVDALADVYEKLALADKRKELHWRAVELTRKDAKTGEDRNRDDNVRYFLERLGDEAKLRAFYKELIAAYPSDYVYSYRYAKWLHERKRPDEALSWIEEADKLCYGANRLKVTLVRAKILTDLDRKSEAKDLLSRDAKAGRKAFPKDAAELEAYRKTL
jgi:thioredoxin-related protein